MTTRVEPFAQQTLDNVKNLFGGKGKLAAIALAIVIPLFLLYSTWSNAWTQGVRYETQLSTQYLDNQNYLSTYISTFYEQVGVATAASEQLNTILTDAVKGRYEGSSAGTGGYTVNSPFFNAIVEAYPETSLAQLVANWGRIQDYVISGRESYRNVQSKLLDQLRTYDTWRNSGVFNRFFLGLVGIPSENLVARVGDSKLTNEEALDKMYQIVLASDAIDAYEDGTLDPLEIN